MLLATLGAGFIEGPPHLTWVGGNHHRLLRRVLCRSHFVDAAVHARMDPLALTFTFLRHRGRHGHGARLLTTKTGSGAADLVGVLRVDGVLIRCCALVCWGPWWRSASSTSTNVIWNPFARPSSTPGTGWATLYGLVLGLVGWTPWILVGGGLLVVGNLMVELNSHDEEE